MARIGEMFDGIDKRYDFLNHLFSLFLDYRWRRIMVRELLPLGGQKVLDLASGTGDSATDLVRKGFEVTGLDLSINMLRRAKAKIAAPRFLSVVGSAYTMPFRDEAFHGVTCAFGIRNMHETPLALAEIFRVLKRGGTVVFLEFSMPGGLLRIPYRFYLRCVMPGIARFISQKDAYIYLAQSIEAFHSPDEFCRLITAAGFRRCARFPLTFGLVYIHKAVKE